MKEDTWKWEIAGWKQANNCQKIYKNNAAGIPDWRGTNHHNLHILPNEDAASSTWSCFYSFAPEAHINSCLFNYRVEEESKEHKGKGCPCIWEAQTHTLNTHTHIYRHTHTYICVYTHF